jgi:hypothetical protein
LQQVFALPPPFCEQRPAVAEELSAVPELSDGHAGGDERSHCNKRLRAHEVGRPLKQALCRFSGLRHGSDLTARLGRRGLSWRGCVLAVRRESWSRASRAARHASISSTASRKRCGRGTRRKAAKK